MLISDHRFLQLDTACTLREPLLSLDNCCSGQQKPGENQRLFVQFWAAAKRQTNYRIQGGLRAGMLKKDFDVSFVWGQHLVSMILGTRAESWLTRSCVARTALNRADKNRVIHNPFFWLKQLKVKAKEKIFCKNEKTGFEMIIEYTIGPKKALVWSILLIALIILRNLTPLMMYVIELIQTFTR